MDPKLASWLARQRAKEDGLEAREDAAVPLLGGAASESPVDPVLAARWAKQRTKEEEACSTPSKLDALHKMIPSPCRYSPSAPKDSPSRLDPVLQSRFARQLAKESRGEATPTDVGSAAVSTMKFDPVLERRLAEQKLKLQTGASAVDESRLTAAEAKVTRTKAVEEKLEKRMTSQLEKVLTGAAAFEGDIGSAAGPCSTRVSDELAACLERRRRRADGDDMSDPAAVLATAWAAEKYPSPGKPSADEEEEGWWCCCRNPPAPAVWSWTPTMLPWTTDAVRR